MRLCRVGLRKSLGWDALRRRYWALGGAAGAWRVYVEEDDGKRWGWYDGEGRTRQTVLLVQHPPHVCGSESLIRPQPGLSPVQSLERVACEPVPRVPIAANTLCLVHTVYLHLQASS